MKFLEVLKNKKLFLLNTFLTVYVGINMIGGERGLVSYFEKQKIEKTLASNLVNLSKELNSLENKKLIALIIEFLSDLQLIILSAHSLPFCLSPMLIVPILKEGTSIIPLDELPTTPST